MRCIVKNELGKRMLLNVGFGEHMLFDDPHNFKKIGLYKHVDKNEDGDYKLYFYTHNEKTGEIKLLDDFQAQLFILQSKDEISDYIYELFPNLKAGVKKK